MVKVYKQLKKVGYPSLAVEGNSRAIPTEFMQLEGPFEYSTATRFSVTDNHLFVWGGNDAVASFAPGEWSHVEVE